MPADVNPFKRLQSLILPMDQRRAVLEAIGPRVSAEHYEWIEGMAEFLGLLQQKNMSIGKLRDLVFGAQTETLKRVGGRTAQKPRDKKRTKGGQRGGKNNRRRPTNHELAQFTPSAWAQAQQRHHRRQAA